MKNLISLTILVLLSLYNLCAQNGKGTFEKDFNRAEKSFSEVYKHAKGELLNNSKDGYAASLPIFLELYEKNPENMNLAFKIGVCHQSSRINRSKAIPYFSTAVTSVSKDCQQDSYKEKNAPLITYKFLGDAYHLDYQFDKAIEIYEKFKALMAENNSMDKDLFIETNRKIEECKSGKQLVANPMKVKIENMGSTINSPYADYSPVLSADQNTLFFTSRRPNTKNEQKDSEGNFMEDIYMATKTKTGWAKAEGIGAPINTDWHEATVGISPDGQTILIYKDDYGIGNIYSTSLDGDKWSNPVKLNDNINTKHWEPSAFISADGNSLYFTSDRPGGFGGRDLYLSKRKHDGDWEKAVNMGPNINTIYDEDAPFIHPDGVTLMFSSSGHNTMGGFDVFTSLLSSDGNWSQPVNAGYPINTTDDDIFYMVSPDSRTAYFSSFREGGYGGKDNYQMTFLNREPTPLTLIKGNVYDESGKTAKKVFITVTDNETEEVVGVYNTNSKTGQFLFILTPGKNYNITYQGEGHLFYSENMEIPKKSNYYEIKREVLLNPIVVGSKIILNNIFFDFDKATLRPLSNVELKNLLQLMKSNPNLKVEISGHTDSKGDAKYNQKLSEERAQAVVSKLEANGIKASRMKAKGYGKAMPAALNKNANGTDNPEGRQLNRRVELKITEIN
ncbi:MAG: PD40 domain-containing protein [Bacteroidetes bacterium]|nr:PD40 domain-containing protein [Bacteroidota bacterium]HET6245096.1 OmpA family protein [Bacteroidia bacterium]